MFSRTRYTLTRIIHERVGEVGGLAPKPQGYSDMVYLVRLVRLGDVKCSAWIVPLMANNPGWQAGSVLHLIEYTGSWKHFEEGPRVSLRGGSNIRGSGETRR